MTVTLTYKTPLLGQQKNLELILGVYQGALLGSTNWDRKYSDKTKYVCSEHADFFLVVISYMIPYANNGCSIDVILGLLIDLDLKFNGGCASVLQKY
jgi:hypothetical protein